MRFKRQLSLILAISMILSFLPTTSLTVFAEGEVEETIKGKIQYGVDKSELEEVLEQANTYTEDEYTKVSLGKFKKTLTSAQGIYENEEATEIEVEKAIASLKKDFEILITIGDYKKLDSEIEKKESLNEKDYTKSSWNNLWEVESDVWNDVYNPVGSAYSNLRVTNSQVIEAYEKLVKAVSELEALTLTEISTANELSSIDGTGSYVLTKDITGYKGNDNTLSGEIDGNGHTIEFISNAKPLFNKIIYGGEVRNIGLKGTVKGGGAFAEIFNGSIFNSYSWADVDNGDKPAGGAVGIITKEDPASITNTYITGDIKGSKVGALIGEIEYDKWNNNKLSNNYWLEGNQGVGVKNEKDKTSGGEEKTLDEIKSFDFNKSLNEGIIRDYLVSGIKWNRNEEGFSYFGIESAPKDEFYPVTLTRLDDKSTETINNKSEILTTSMFGKDSKYVAELSLGNYDNEVKWEVEYDGLINNSPIKLNKRDGKVQVFVDAPGDITVKIIDKVTNEEIQDFKLKAEIPEQLEIYLKIEDVDYSDKTFETAGSEGFSIDPWISIDGKEPIKANYTLFDWSSDNPSVINIGSDAWVTVKEEGKAAITVSLGETKKTMNVMSGYTPFTSIKSKFQGDYIIHSRNPNSIGQNNTPGVASFNPLRNREGVGSEFNIVDVLPENATYKNKYTVNSSDNDVLTYKGEMANSLLPFKEGEVDLTVTSNDPELDKQVSDTKKVNVKYFNPLKSLKVEKKQLDVKEKEIVSAGLAFTGPESKNGYRVTESNMKWEQTGEGEVSAYRSYPVIMTSDEDGSLEEGTVSNDKWLIRGVKKGKVKLIGTPVDNKNGAKPITLNITVSENDNLGEEKPSKERVKTSLDKTADHLLGKMPNPTFGSEWGILGLARSGYDVPENYYENYYASAYETAKEEVNKESNRWDNKVTETQRLALALTAIGKDPRDVNGVNLLDYSWNKPGSFPGMEEDTLGDRQGSNELMFALLSIEANDSFTKPDSATMTVDEMINRLIDDYQNKENGGFGLSSNKSTSTDMTAMAIQALAKHYDKPNIKIAVDKALINLSKGQGSDGSYGTSEATSQVIVALTEMKIDPNKDERFSKGGFSLLDGLLTYEKENGGFAHSFGGNENAMATEQALYALASLDCLYNDKNTLYNMNDVKIDDKNQDEEKNVTGVTISKVDSEIEIDKSIKLKATVLPAEASNKGVKWSSSNDEVAKVDKDGLVIGISEGTSVITVTTDEGSKTDSMNITVKKAGEVKPEEQTEATLSIDKKTIGKGYVLSSNKIEIIKDETVWDVTKREMEKNNVSYRSNENSPYNSVYIESIDGDGEFDHGEGSGWMYSVDGVFPDHSASVHELSGGEVIKWRYTTNLGKDLGKEIAEDENEPIIKDDDVELEIDTEGNDNVEVSDKDINKAVKKALKENKDNIVLNSNANSENKSLSFKVTNDSIKNISDNISSILFIS